MKSLNVRERIVEISSRLFYENGYSQTGINQIITEANVSKASLYHHFKSKEDIAVEYLQERHIKWMHFLSKCCVNQISSKEMILEVFNFLEVWAIEVDYRGCSWQNIFTELPINHHKIRNQVIFSKSEIQKWIYKVLNEDECRNKKGKEVYQLSKQILVLMEGAYILSQIEKHTWPIKSAKEVCVNLLD